MALFAGCGDSEREPHLTGSLLDVYNGHFDEVRIRLYSSELAIEYVRFDGEVPVRVTASASALERAPLTLRFPDDGAVTGRSGSVRVPEVVGGELVLDAFEEEEGAAVEGRFRARFVAGGDTLVLSGRFVGELEIVDDKTPPDFE